MGYFSRIILIINCRAKLIIILGSILFLYSQDNLYSQNNWVQKANFGGGQRAAGITFSIGNKGYLGAGLNGLTQKDFWEYNPANNSWTQKADIGGSVRYGGIGFSIAGKGYIGLGNNNSGLSFKDFWEYDPTLNSWTQKTDFGGTARLDAVGFVIGNYGYVGTGTDGAFQKDFWRYDPNSDSWSRMADFGGLPRSTAVGFSIGNFGYIATGSNGITGFQDIWEYNTATDSWVQKSSVAALSRGYGVGFSIANKGYLGVGLNGGYKNDFWEYDPSLDIWTQKTNYGGNQVIQAIALKIGNKGYFGIGVDNVATLYQDFWEYSPGTTPSININSINEIIDNSAKINANIIFDGNYTVSSKGIVWSTAHNPTVIAHTNGGITNNSIANSSFTDDINGLKQNTLYYYRAYATNTIGTSYSEENSFTTLTTSAVIENKSPNSGDANGDGIQDSQQDYVASIISPNSNKYISVVSLDKYPILNLEILNPTGDKLYVYPDGQVKFTIAHSSARVKIYYYNLSNLKDYLFRKMDFQNHFFTLQNTIYKVENIGGTLVATVEFTLNDGGQEDYDGVVNGTITDPGGIAILATDYSIPAISLWARIILISLIFILGLWFVKK